MAFQSEINATDKDRWWQARLSDAGYKLTEPRKLVLDVMQASTDHLSAEDIYIKALKIMPSIGLTTVYRTLELLTDVGLAQRFDFGDGKARFELTNSAHKPGHHHHLVCTRCKTIIDYDDFVQEEIELMNRTEKELSKNHQFKITHHIIHFYGVCQDCRQAG